MNGCRNDHGIDGRGEFTNLRRTRRTRDFTHPASITIGYPFRMNRTFGFRRAVSTDTQSRTPLRVDVLAALTNWMMVREVRSIEPVAEKGDSFFCRLQCESDEGQATEHLEFECSRFGVAPLDTRGRN